MAIKEIQLPEELIKDIGIERSQCLVIIKNNKVFCSSQNKRTIHGCRGTGENHGCPLRDTSREFEKEVEILNKHNIVIFE
ncbi:hypothetical protein KW795_01525 [Candidatus Microgenomates bacterium]|nr:hypothetical protein [Candidatus Microgenomates bacterium]